MTWGPKQIYYASTASGASTSGAIDMGDKSFSKWAVTYATMSTGALVTVLGSDSSSGTYKQINQLVPSTSTVAYQAMQIATAISGSGWAVFDAPPIRYIKFITSDVVSGGVSYTVYAAD